MSGINQLQIFKATVEHKNHQEFLFYANFTPSLKERILKNIQITEDKIKEYFGMFNPVNIGEQVTGDYKIGEKLEFDKYYRDLNLPADAFIDRIGVLRLPGSLYHFTKRVSPLRKATTLAEIEDFPYPELPEYDLDKLKKQVQQAHQENRVALMTVGAHMYEFSWQVRGYQEFLQDMLLNPDICEYILDKFYLRNLKMAEAAAKAGVDLILTGDDIANQNGMMFHPRLWRKFIKSRWAKVYQTARNIKPDIQIKYHSDGNILGIIPELIEIGVTILNPIQPECLNPVEIKKKFGKRIVLDGTIGTQTTMPFGSPEEIKKVIKERKETLGQDGGLILAPTHILEPEVPLENVYAFIEACESG